MRDWRQTQIGNGGNSTFIHQNCKVNYSIPLILNITIIRLIQPFRVKRYEDRIRTRAVSVDEFDAVDVQCHSQVDRPPRVCRAIAMRTGSTLQMCVVVAVVGIGGVI